MTTNYTKRQYVGIPNYTKWTENIPNGHKIYQHFPFQRPPKYTQNWNFGIKINYLAALVRETLTKLKRIL
jgi:hypothetical protein